ncbi:hybrid sensor histidine kinase/response regulator [Variovorax sp. EL159]|uniref:ATP-binding response regulator n=1 Tax=Variovorax sp. EL159 TaxID=1566270 RepID=UPI000891FA43|nr:hybrid sensor histidine kinase/response regulator [Variovorax sp. EL159]SCX53641.1 Signal transduction histidine kinase [Variovorax sp. EL159]
MNNPAIDTSSSQRVLREHLASVYASRKVGVWAHLGFTFLGGALGYFHLKLPTVLPLVAMLVCVDLYVLSTPRWHPDVPVADSPRWARRHMLQMILTGVATAPVPWFFISTHDPEVTALMAILIMVGSGLAMQALWPMKASLFGYGIPMMGGLIGALIWHSDGVNLFLAAIGIAYLVLALRRGVRQNKQLTDALVLRFENESLVSRLGEQIAATERASEEKTRFLATASHDLRQPLHAIALFGAALQNELHDRPERKNAERLMRAVNALGNSLDTMLDVSRLDAGVITPDVRLIPLDALLVSLNHVFLARAEQAGLQLRVQASGVWVRSDPQLLQRMLSNLVDNALKYTVRGGVIVRVRTRGENVWIEVRDTGIGIAPEQLGRIFEEFYQIGNSGRDRSRGLGIGLSIVQRLSRLLDHPVQVQSRVDRGTRFRVQLPSASAPADMPFNWRPGTNTWREHQRPAPMPTPTVSPALPRRVLLIDDEAEIRQGMSELLRSYAIDVEAVADEATAATALSQADVDGRPFELLLCDYRLADGGSGLDAGLRLRWRGGRRIPLLLITGETAPDRLQRVRESGVPVLFKPVDTEKLLQVIGMTLGAAVAGVS